MCLCVCCEWNVAYINRLNLTCQTLKGTLRHHVVRIARRGDDGQHVCICTDVLGDEDVAPEKYSIPSCGIFKVNSSLGVSLTSEVRRLQVGEVI